MPDLENLLKAFLSPIVDQILIDSKIQDRFIPRTEIDDLISQAVKDQLAGHLESTIEGQVKSYLDDHLPDEVSAAVDSSLSGQIESTLEEFVEGNDSLEEKIRAIATDVVDNATVECTISS
jgi:hypothetical protein